MNTTLQAHDDPIAATVPEGSVLPRRILVVDDDGVLRHFNAAILLRAGYVVDVAEDGAAAWDVLQSNNYDLLITDNNMPRLTGLDLVKRLRSFDLGLPVIMATGSLKELDPNAGPESVYTLAKPYSTDQLLAMVKRVLLSEDLAESHALKSERGAENLAARGGM